MAGLEAVRLPNWLGDALLARPALDHLAATPGVRLCLAAPPPLVALLAADYPAAEWLATAPGLAAGRRLGRAWRARGVQRLWSLPVSPGAQLAAALSGAGERVGFARRPGELRDLGAGWGMTRRVPRGARGRRHLADEYLDLVGATGDQRPLRPLRPPAGAAAGAAAVLGERPEPYVAVAPGARYGPAKRWPAERFAAAARAAAELFEAGRVVVVGESAERDACERVAAEADGVSLAGRTDLPALCGVLAGAAAVLANDSGAAHLAAALGRPTAVIFGSTDPRWTAPRGPHVAVLWQRVRCAPCFRRRCPWQDAYACLRLIEPRDVVAELRRLRARAAA